jgi:hypothetical protein
MWRSAAALGRKPLKKAGDQPSKAVILLPVFRLP